MRIDDGPSTGVPVSIFRARMPVCAISTAVIAPYFLTRSTIKAWDLTSVSSQNLSIGRLEISDVGSISATCMEMTPHPPSAFISRIPIDPLGINGLCPVACGTE